MSLNAVCFSSVLSGLLVNGGSFDSPGFAASSGAASARNTVFGSSLPAASAAPAAVAPTRNLRRFRYKSFGVISDDEISLSLRINIALPRAQLGPMFWPPSIVTHKRADSYKKRTLRELRF